MGDMLVTSQAPHVVAVVAAADNNDVDELRQRHVSLMYGRIYHTSPSTLHVYASQRLVLLLGVPHLLVFSRIHAQPAPVCAQSSS